MKGNIVTPWLGMFVIVVAITLSWTHPQLYPVAIVWLLFLVCTIVLGSHAFRKSQVLASYRVSPYAIGIIFLPICAVGCVLFICGVLAV